LAPAKEARINWRRVVQLRPDLDYLPMAGTAAKFARFFKYVDSKILPVMNLAARFF
jgi:hypothetical protein